MKQAAEVLNVPAPANWVNFINPTTTNGSIGQAQVGSSNIATIMENWSIPQQFRNQAIQNVKLLIAAADEGSYTAQAFIFDIQSSASLTSLIVVAKRIASPADPNIPVSVAYVTINTNGIVKKLYDPPYENCERCSKCLWTGHCCCNTVIPERGITPEELNIVKQKMTADQFIWFNQQQLSRAVQRTIVNNDDDIRSVDLTQAIENFLSNKNVQAEVLASYNDSILTALQSNFTSLKLSSQTLKMAKVEYKHILNLLKALSEDYAFDDFSSNSQFLQQLQSSRFSYENLFTTSSTGYDKKNTTIKYIWIIGQNHDNTTYTIHFLHLNISSQALIQTLLCNNTNHSTSCSEENLNNQLNIARTAILTDNGQFLNEEIPKLITPWQLTTTNIVLNILRFIGGSVFNPKQYRLLSYFDPRIISPEDKQTNNDESQSRTIPAKIAALSQALSSVANSWKDIVSSFKTSKSTTITRITRFGFTHFDQKSTVLKAIDIPGNKASEFINAIVMDYNLPSKGSFLLGLTYSDDFSWDDIEYLYSPTMDGKYRSLTLFKNGDSIINTASFFIVDINADWQLAPDLLLIQTSKSYLGGLFESSKQSIQEVPHVLTLEEAKQLQQFFMMIAISNLAGTLGMNLTYPSLT
ncbi:unnamed protein product [Rotaria sordida]|uniref:Uncharacterized protein n=1 Tax=Rotaria sordida TaxID=392033 RepID=A0A819DQY8_9BILA|nr:unnamed protein product [Rotaria sordida]CAF3835809.1 unnamed protein product [Rotaria sordida]